MINVSFVVHDVGVPQGSKTPWGTEANEKLAPWRKLVGQEGRQAWGNRPPTHEAIALNIIFIFPRPKHHYGTGKNAAVIKPGSPDWVTRTPDLDKLCRAIGDALTGVIWHDDSQIVILEAGKSYGHEGRVSISVKTPDERLSRLVHASDGDIAHARSVERMLNEENA